MQAQLPAWISDKRARLAWPSNIDGIELVWRHLNGPPDLRPFLASDVRWAECDARSEPADAAGAHRDRELSGWLADIAASGRAARIELTQAGPMLDGVLGAAKSSTIRGRDLWFSAAVDAIGGRKGFKLLASSYPRARLSVPVDDLAPWLLVAPKETFGLLDGIRAWGIRWLSVSGRTPSLRQVVHLLTEDGWQTDVRDVGDDVQMRKAVASRPTSITADLGVIAAVDHGRFEMGGTNGEPLH